jgi:phospholipid/cholesterol/gamma-HCH transport system substrate-binding protein
MRLHRRIKVQLALFLVIAVGAMAALALGPVHLPATLFGIGTYKVTVELAGTGGLYQRANVTYRGLEVGRVTDVRFTDTGVAAVLSLTSEVDVPSDLTAQVRSQSVIGEQYIALVPRDPQSRPLRGGDVITADRTSTPPDIGDLLDRTHSALAAIPKDNLKTVVDESYTAVGGLGPEIGRIVDATTSLATDARGSLGELTNIIDNSQPLLNSQVATSDSVTAWASHLATITTELRDHDDAVSGLLKDAGPAADEVKALLDRINPTLPILLANLVSVTDVALVYQPNIEQVLVLLPQAVRMIFGLASANLNQKLDIKGSFQSFATNLNLPAPCVTGYLPASQRRSPVLVDAPDRPPGDLYCRIPQDSPHNVRGARNYPCAGKPGKRAPTVWMCESDEEYVPLNSGDSWKGDPNATLSGQDVPQRPSVAGPPASSDGRPPASTAPAALGFSDYNPVDGTYIGPDGQVYTQRNLAQDAAPPTLRSMLIPPSTG